MRIDKFLKVSRIIKRRTVANNACDSEHVKVNGKDAKASYNVKVGDVIEVAFGERIIKIRVKEYPVSQRRFQRLHGSRRWDSQRNQ